MRGRRRLWRRLVLGRDGQGGAARGRDRRDIRCRPARAAGVRRRRRVGRVRRRRGGGGGGGAAGRRDRGDAAGTGGGGGDATAGGVRAARGHRRRGRLGCGWRRRARRLAAASAAGARAARPAPTSRRPPRASDTLIDTGWKHLRRTRAARRATRSTTGRGRRSRCRTPGTRPTVRTAATTTTAASAGTAGTTRPGRVRGQAAVPAVRRRQPGRRRLRQRHVCSASTPAATPGSASTRPRRSSRAGQRHRGQGDQRQQRRHRRRCRPTSRSSAASTATSACWSTDPLHVDACSTTPSPGVYLRQRQRHRRVGDRRRDARKLFNNNSPAPPVGRGPHGRRRRRGNDRRATSRCRRQRGRERRARVAQTVTIANPHRWNGVADPYLYNA